MGKKITKQVKQFLAVVGLDLSLRESGVVVSTDKSDEFHERDIISRAEYIAESILKLIEKTVKTSETLCIIEGYGFAAKGRVFDLAEVGGIVKKTLTNSKCPYIVITPGQLKKYATGIGNANKEQVRTGIIMNWNTYIENNNVCDAYVLARIGRAFIGQDVNLSNYQKDIIKDLHKKYDSLL